MATDTSVNTTVCVVFTQFLATCDETEKHSDSIAGKSCDHDTSSKKIPQIHKEKKTHLMGKGEH